MKIVALNGLLGYGYSEEALEVAFSEKVDYVGVDAGSTDPGPYYLGSGKSFTDRGAVKRDLSLALPKALEQKAPFIIGTAGGAGAKAHTDWLLDIIREIAQEKNLSFTDCSNVSCKVESKASFTHCRTCTDKNKVGTVKTRKHLIKVGKARCKAFIQILVFTRQLLQTIINVAYDNIAKL